MEESLLFATERNPASSVAPEAGSDSALKVAGEGSLDLGDEGQRREGE